MELSQPGSRNLPVKRLASIQPGNRGDLFDRQPRRAAGRPAHRDMKDAGLTLQ